MYTIMGVTGKVGGAAARALLAEGRQLRVVVRDRAKGERWAARGCEIAVADLDNADALAAAFRGRKPPLSCCRRFSIRHRGFLKPGR